MCIFFSSTILHKVSKFQPKISPADVARQNITPGRIGTVFFFPRVSHRILRNKPTGWGYRTGFGMNANLLGDEADEYSESGEEVDWDILCRDFVQISVECLKFSCLNHSNFQSNLSAHQDLWSNLNDALSVHVWFRTQNIYFYSSYWSMLYGTEVANLNCEVE